MGNTSDSKPVRKAPPPVLQDDYYLQNFMIVLDRVLEVDAHLFSASEFACLTRWKRLPEPLQRLYVRLFNRRGPYFQVHRLDYPEIGPLSPVVEALHAASFAQLWVEWHETIDPADLLRCFTMTELKPLAQQTGCPLSPRGAMLEGLLALPLQDLGQALLSRGPVVCLIEAPLLARVQRLFFLNSHQDATTFVTVDLAHVRYPDYRIWRTRPVFADRLEFEAYLKAQALRDRFHEARMAKDATEALWVGQEALAAFLASPPGPADFLSRYSARTVHGKTALRMVRWAEPALGREVAAGMYVQLLEAGLPEPYRGEAWARLALHRERTEGAEAAILVCRAGLKEESTRRGERLDLQKRRVKLEVRLARAARAGGKRSAKSRGDAREAKPIPAGEPGPAREVIIRRPLLESASHRRVTFTNAQGGPVSVEGLALEAYGAAGVGGIFAENTFFTTLAGLLCWDILFAEVPDVFLTPFQDAPLDLMTDTFFPRRRRLIEGRIEAIRGGDLHWLYAHYNGFKGCVARGVAWGAFSLHALALGASRLGGPLVAAIVGHLLEDYRHRSRGLPDLLLWRSRESSGDSIATTSLEPEVYWGEAGYVPPAEVWFAEVKSTRDRLSTAQRAWMGVLAEFGATVELCRVTGVR